MENLLISLSAECVYFLKACLLGLALGAFYDFFRILRRTFKHNGILIAAQDLFYCFVAGYATFCFLLKYCDGRLRWFVFIGELIGWVLFRITLGELFVSIGTAILSIIVKLIKLVFHLINKLFTFIIAPFLFLARLIKKKLILILKKCLDNVKKVCLNRKYRLKKRAKLLYNRYIPHFRGGLRLNRQRGSGRGKAKKT